MRTTSLPSFDFDVFNLTVKRTAGVVTGMIFLDVLWWILVLDGHVPMPGMMWLMDQGIMMSAPGAMEAGAAHVGGLVGYGEYTVMWGVMMWAMMFPAMTRYTREYAENLRGSTALVAATVVAFLAAYMLMWTLSAVVPLALNAALPGGINGVVMGDTHLAVGLALGVAGVYQLSMFKQRRLRECCARVREQDADPMKALGQGLRHGFDCILVCFGFFFVIMPVFGSMNPFWMVVLTFPITLERLPNSWGREMSMATGLVSLAAGLVVLLFQPALPL